MKKIKNSDIKVLKLLRKNSRQNLIDIGKKADIHSTTTHYIIEKLNNTIINKNTCLIDWERLGFGLRIDFAVKTKQREKLIDFLKNDNNVDSVFKLRDNFDIYIKTIFKSIKEVYDFLDDIEEFDIQNIREYHIIKDIVLEKFSLY